MNAKAAASRHQRQVLELARLPGNDFCADCTGRNPRWASHNLGIFLCISCAGIHRKLGTHISKVKSLTLDEWSREQIAVMKEVGNIKSNAYYNPDERRNRPPANIEDSERDGELERFIRAKYEFRRFMDKRPPPLPKKDPPSPVHGHRSMTVSNGSSSSSATASRNGTLAAPPSSSSVGKGILRSSTAPIPSSWKEAKRAASPLPPPPPRDEAHATNPPPSIAVSSPGQRSSQVFASAASMNGMNGFSTSTLSPSGYTNGAQPPLPTRASSALAFSSSSATTTPTLSSSGTGSSSSMLPSQQPHLQQSQQSSFQGRSSVFDDLLELSKPAAPPPQPQLQQPRQMAYNNPYDQQGIMSSLQMGMNGMGLHANQSATTMANPWAQQQQQQQMLMANYQQSSVTTPMGLSAGAMMSSAHCSSM
jgi:stromal membrane-associated protein